MKDLKSAVKEAENALRTLIDLDEEGRGLQDRASARWCLAMINRELMKKLADDNIILLRKSIEELVVRQGEMRRFHLFALAGMHSRVDISRFGCFQLI